MTPDRPWALVTGASSGIGAEYARLLAAKGFDLWLVARREDRLRDLAATLAASGAQVRVDPCDLAELDQLRALADRIRSHGRLDVLVHNAGFGVRGEVGEADPAKLARMARVHVDATIELTSAVVPGMKSRRQGHVVVVASIAGKLLGAGSATYCATKAFQISFARSLNRELQPFGAHAQALCPGYTRTEFHDTPEYDRWDRTSVPRFLWATPRQVVEASWADRDREECVPGFLNRMVMAASRLPVTGLVRSRLRRAKKP